MKKNWKKIAETEDDHWMRAFALLDLSAETEFSKELIRQHPDYFQEKDGDLIPLSIIRRLDQYRKNHPSNDPAVYRHYWRRMADYIFA
ncbi:MAG: hypothetical protein AAB791_03410, partial [Patescibacteria group bacterium]